MIEILVSLVIVTLGLLGLAGLQARSLTAEFESYQRTQAVLLASQMVEMIKMNRANRGGYKAISDPSDGTGHLGTGGSGSFTLTCPGSTSILRDLCLWHDSLLGKGEMLAGNEVGAMIGARGCIFYDAGTELPGIPDTGNFTVVVTWQGTANGDVSSTNCANGLYGNEALRRVVALTFRLAQLD